VTGLDRRLREAARLGFTRAIVPRPTRGPALRVPGLEVIEVGSLRDAIRATIGEADPDRGGGRRNPSRMAEARPPMLG
jgi:DNA repair protein RadA/Sms